MSSRYLTKREAAEYAHVSTRTIERAVAAGALVARGTPGVALFLPEDLDAWLAHRGRARSQA